MSDQQRCLNCLQETQSFYPCQQCAWSPDKQSESGLYLSPGTLLHNQYQIAKVLGHGGFGITYLALDTNLQIKLAIKEYMPRDFATRNSTNAEVSTFAGDAKENFAYGLNSFLEEARTLAQFQQHAGIVSVLNFFKANGTGYMVMEYVEGLTLKEHLVNKGKLSWDQTLQLFMPVMDALREVHKHGMLHRDIAPDNIYLCRDNRIKLLDFGSARYALGGHSRSLSVVVKPGYAPEEQYRTKGNQGAWTDVYSVAASMYRCVTSVVPPDALDRLDEDELARPSELGVEIPANAEQALLAALAVKGVNRTQSIEQFQQALLGTATSNKKDETFTKSVKPVTGKWKDSPLQKDAVKHKKGYGIVWGLATVILVSLLVYYGKDAINTYQQTSSDELNKALQFSQQGNYGEALKIWKLIADQGKANAQYNLGVMYAKGQGVPKDDQQAMQWFRKAADQGYARAQYNLGVIYQYGQGVTQDESQAMLWFRKAADQGLAHAQHNLGFMYAEGQGVPKDDQQAVQWYRKAADQGLANAQYNLGNMYVEGQGVPKDDQQAAQWFRKAADQGYADAQNNLGLMYVIGQGVPKDDQQAAQWFRKAADQGDANGQYYLGVMYAEGQGVPKDDQQAVHWLRKAAKQGNNNAIKVLKDMGVKP